MIFHLLDTSAAIEVVETPRSAFRSYLQNEVAAGATAWIPAPVLIEVEQATRATERGLQRLWDLADVWDLDDNLARAASTKLRDVKRTRCPSCRGFEGPSIVDAVIMAIADNLAKSDTKVVVHTQDLNHLPALKAKGSLAVIQRV